MLTTAPSHSGLLHGEARAFERKGRDPCLLAFHGFTGSPSEIMPVLQAAADAGFAVHAPLQPGHGTNPADLQHKTFEDWIAAGRQHFIAAAREHERVVVMGFSMGSLVALKLASEGLPQLTGLVVLGNALFLSAPSALPLGLLTRLKGTPDLYLLKPRAADMEDRTLVDTIVTYDRHPIRAAHEVFRAGAVMRAELLHVRCPTLILHGKKDRVCPSTNATYLADHLTNAASVKVRVYPRSAHVIGCDFDRAEVSADVVSFLTNA